MNEKVHGNENVEDAESILRLSSTSSLQAAQDVVQHDVPLKFRHSEKAVKLYSESLSTPHDTIVRQRGYNRAAARIQSCGSEAD